MKFWYQFLIVTLSTLLLPVSILSAWKTKKPTAPTCPRAYNTILLPSAPSGYICLSDDYYSNIHYYLSSYKSRIDAGDDINPLLTEIRTSMKNDEEYQNTEEAKMYAVILDRLKQYWKVKCDLENQKPTIQIWTNGIYADDRLTPTCSYPPPRIRGTNIFLNLSLTWMDQDGNRVIYVWSGWSFSWVTIDRQWTGKHILTCTYRPSSCTDARKIQKEIILDGTPTVKKRVQSIARIWNEVMLNAIRKDKVRPPIQARNLFHFGAAIYDIWTLYHPGNRPYLFWVNTDIKSCQIPASFSKNFTKNDIERAMSYTAYRIIESRYKESPGYSWTLLEANAIMNRYGYSPRDTRFDLTKFSDPTALGNAVARCYLDFGKIDGSNEQWVSSTGESGSHGNMYYTPLNPSLDPNSPGNPDISDWNRWQPIALSTFIDQGGNPVSGGAANFIGAEWGNVKPFSLREDQKTIHERDGQRYITYLDPGDRPQIVSGESWMNTEKNDLYIWNFSLVGIWSSHLNPNDPTMIDISPRHLGNSAPLPTSFSDMRNYYDLTRGWVKTLGREINPKTEKPYETNWVKRGDYTRVIAEFWADGPKSETPPWHWFTLLNAVSDKIPEKRFEWTGPVLNNLEWDVKSYFILGGALHDSAIGAWGMKWAYDGVRPISAIRAMADHGQSSDLTLSSYDPRGFRLIPWYIELVGTGDVLEGKWGKNIGKIKMRAWKWPKYINNPEIDVAGSDWILAENWWPYQRPSFVTPPFAGYTSGHSTFSRAAAEVLTDITGDEYFPGGLFEFRTKSHDYLVFEQWPSVDMTLQWATYRDAADESALSRIWWGIHPPMDDIPGRIMGGKIGQQAFEFGKSYFKK